RKNISLPELNGFDVEEVKDCMYGLFDSDQFPEDLRDLINYNEGGFHPLEYLLMHPEFAEAFPIYNGRRIIS
ncbi:hypothetical protein HYX17_01430, partial [Candidatus Woesearchaeota archaeon]|nr:hypothetical protein [Candidatus Woesearchaeota archaeon]